MSYLPESFARRLDNEVIFVVFYSTLIATAVWSKNIRFTLFDTSIGAFSVLAIVTLALFFFSAINVRRFFVSVRSVPPLHIITTFLLMVVLFLLDDHPYQLQKVIKYAAYMAIILQLMQLDQNILARTWNGAGCTCFFLFCYSLFSQINFVEIWGLIDGQWVVGGAKRFYFGTSLPNSTAFSLLVSINLVFLALLTTKSGRFVQIMAIPVLSAFCIFLIYTQSRSAFLVMCCILGLAFASKNLRPVILFVVVVTGAYFAFVDIGHILHGFVPRFLGIVADGFGGRVSAICMNLPFEVAFCTSENPLLQKGVSADISAHNLFVSSLSVLSPFWSIFASIATILYFIYWGFICFSYRELTSLCIFLTALAGSCTNNVSALHSLAILFLILPAITKRSSKEIGM